MTEAEYTGKNIDLLWGAREIAKEIDRTERQVFHLLQAGNLPAKRVGGRWCIDRAILRRFFQGEQDASRVYRD